MSDKQPHPGRFKKSLAAGIFALGTTLTGAASLSIEAGKAATSAENARGNFQESQTESMLHGLSELEGQRNAGVEYNRILQFGNIILENQVKYARYESEFSLGFTFKNTKTNDLDQFLLSFIKDEKGKMSYSFYTDIPPDELDVYTNLMNEDDKKAFVDIYQKTIVADENNIPIGNAELKKEEAKKMLDLFAGVKAPVLDGSSIALNSLSYNISYNLLAMDPKSKLGTLMAGGGDKVENMVWNGSREVKFLRSGDKMDLSENTQNWMLLQKEISTQYYDLVGQLAKNYSTNSEMVSGRTDFESELNYEISVSKSPVDALNTQMRQQFR